MSLTELLSTIHGPLSVEIYGQVQSFSSGEAALTEKYDVVEISADQLRLKLKHAEAMSTVDALKAAYAAVMSDEGGAAL